MLLETRLCHPDPSAYGGLLGTASQILQDHGLYKAPTRKCREHSISFINTISFSATSTMAPVALSSSSMSNTSPISNGIHKPTHTSTWRATEITPPPERTAFAFDAMEDALAAFAAGEFLVVMDDENRENEGDLIISGSQCTTEKMAWMIKHTRYAPLCARSTQSTSSFASRKTTPGYVTRRLLLSLDVIADM